MQLKFYQRSLANLIKQSYEQIAHQVDLQMTDFYLNPHLHS